MKKDIAIVLLFLFTLAATAQDTVRRGDPWYMFKNPGNLWSISAGHGTAGNNMMLYYGNNPDSIMVYGVAVTQNYIAVEEDRAREAITMTPTVMLLRQDSYGNPPTVSLIDSANVLGLIKKCWFRYPFSRMEKDSLVKPCYEYYFDTPHGFALPVDSFYVSRYWPVERYVNLEQWFRTLPVLPHPSPFEHFYGTIEDVSSLGISFEYWASIASFGADPFAFMQTHSNSSEFNLWGYIFPIINLRCTAPHLYLAGREGDAATVSWWQAEAGEAYQLSLGTYGGNPDSGMLVTPADTFHTFTGLQPDTIYQAWVRKACRYTTAGYDTLVWSDWSQPLVFRASVGIDEVDDDGLRVTVQGGCIAVQGLAAGERAEVYDMKGCRVATLEADGRTAPLPQGVYMLRTQQHHRHRRVVVTR